MLAFSLLICLELINLIVDKIKFCFPDNGTFVRSLSSNFFVFLLDVSNPFVPFYFELDHVPICLPRLSACLLFALLFAHSLLAFVSFSFSELISALCSRRRRQPADRKSHDPFSFSAAAAAAPSDTGQSARGWPADQKTT